MLPQSRTSVLYFCWRRSAAAAGGLCRASRLKRVWPSLEPAAEMLSSGTERSVFFLFSSWLMAASSAAAVAAAARARALTRAMEKKICSPSHPVADLLPVDLSSR